MKKQPEFDVNKTYIITLKFEFRGNVMSIVKEKIEKREEIKLTNLKLWFIEAKNE